MPKWKVNTGCFLVTLLLAQLISAHGQNEKRLRIAFYNVENLFHPEDDSLTSDEEFTPEGQRNWSWYRYKEKTNRMAKAILSIGEWEPPAVVGLAEIENKQVLQDLVETDVLRKFNYGIVHYESPDRRGIDVGMIYRQDEFSTLFTQNIPVVNPTDPDFATRDILYVKGVSRFDDTLHLFFNHWPSRYGGQAQSEPKRVLAANTLKATTDSIYQYNPQAAILIAGDFNDEWENKSLKHNLAARKLDEADSAGYLVNLMTDLPVTEGSHRYRGVWSYLDQIIVSENLLEEDTGVKLLDYGTIKHEFLLETDERYPGLKPFRSFIGLRYNAGFSDHLPVFADIVSH